MYVSLFEYGEEQFSGVFAEGFCEIEKILLRFAPVLACDWIKEKNSFPPMEFQDLVDSQVKDEKVKTEIVELLKRKMAGEELKEEPKIEILNEFLERKIEFYIDYVEQIEPNDKPQTELLDKLFKETIFDVWK